MSGDTCEGINITDVQVNVDTCKGINITDVKVSGDTCKGINITDLRSVWSLAKESISVMLR